MALKENLKLIYLPIITLLQKGVLLNLNSWNGAELHNQKSEVSVEPGFGYRCLTIKRRKDYETTIKESKSI